MGSLLVASHFINTVVIEENQGAADGTTATTVQHLQHQEKTQWYGTTGSNSSKARPSISKNSGRNSEFPSDPATLSTRRRDLPDSLQEPSTTAPPYHASPTRTTIVPPLNMAQINMASVPMAGEADGGLMTSSTSHGPPTFNFQRSASIRVGHEGLSRRSARLMFLQSPPEVRTEADLHFLDDVVLFSAEACAMLTKGARMAIAKLATLVTFEPGDQVCIKGQEMSNVYFVLLGEASSVEPDGSCNSYDEGQSIGYLCDPPVHNPHTPRTRQALRMPQAPVGSWQSTVTATSTMDCAVISQEQWALVRSTEAYWDARQVRSFLEDLPSFGTLSKAQLLQLSRLVRTLHFPSDSVIFRQGHDSDDMYLLRTGFVRILKHLNMDQSSRHRLNQLAAETSALSSNLQVLTSPRGKAPQLLHQLKDAAPRPVAVSEEHDHGSAAFAHQPINPSEGGQGSDQFGSGSKPVTPTMKLPRLPGHSGTRASADDAGRGRLESVYAERRGSPVAEALGQQQHQQQNRAGSPVIGAGAVEGGRAEELVYQRAFSSQTPFLLDKAPQVFVEVGTICSGTIFGDVTSGRRVHRACSAVADTRVEVFQMVRSEIKARLGDALMFLWGTDSVSGKPSTDDAIRGQLEKNMQWELYKKKLMQEVFIKKQGKGPNTPAAR